MTDPAWDLSDLLLLPRLQFFNMLTSENALELETCPFVALYGTSEEYRIFLDKVKLTIEVPACLCVTDGASPLSHYDLRMNGHATVCRCQECSLL